MRNVFVAVAAAALILLAGLEAACGGPQGRAQSLAEILRLRPSAATAKLVAGSPLQLDVIHFVNAKDGWAGGQGVILATRDGGRTWHRQYAGVGDIATLAFLSPHQGFAATSAGLLATSDGRTWHRVTTRPLASATFLSAWRGYGLAPDGYFPPAGQNDATPPAYRILRTRNGGRTWKAAAALRVEAACFPEPGRLIAAVQNDQGVRVLWSADGGTVWVTGLTVAGAYGAQLQCTVDGGAWLLATGGAGMSQESYAVYRSGDFGHTWRGVLAVPTAGGGPAPGNPTGTATGPGLAPGALAVSDKDHAVMLGSCWGCSDGFVEIARTADGGRTWQDAAHPVPAAVPVPLAADLLGGRRVWLLSSAVPIGEVGGGARIQVSPNSGASWRTTALLTASTLAVVAFAGPRQGFGVGLPGDRQAVLATSDGGRNWRKVGELPAGTLSLNTYAPLAVPSARRAFVATNQGLLASRDSGRHWAPVALPQGVAPGSVTEVAFATVHDGCISVTTAAGLQDFATFDGGWHWQATSRVNVPAALCAENLRNPQLVRLALALVAALAPPAGPVGGLQAAGCGGGTLWLLFSANGLVQGRLYVLGSGGSRVVRWPASLADVAGISPVGPSFAYAWTESGQVLRTADAGTIWRQIP